MRYCCISVSSHASSSYCDAGIGAKENSGQLLARDRVSTPVDKERVGPAMSDVDQEPRTLHPESQFKTQQLHVHHMSRTGRDVNTKKLYVILKDYSYFLRVR